MPIRWVRTRASPGPGELGSGMSMKRMSLAAENWMAFMKFGWLLVFSGRSCEMSTEFRGVFGSGENIMHHVAMDIGEAAFDAVVIKGKALVVDAHQV